MNSEPFVIERVYLAPVERVWKALTDKSELKQWYFDITDFRPEVGFEFTFTGGSEERTYVHVCRITQVVPNKKLAYTWRYQDFPGHSEVTFELFPEGGVATRLRLTHSGLETFPKDNQDFARQSFSDGWTMIAGKLLKDFVEKPQ